MLHSTPSWYHALCDRRLIHHTLHHRPHSSHAVSTQLPPKTNKTEYSARWRPLFGVGLVVMLVFAWQVATPRALWAADAIALSDEWRFVDESKPGAPILTGKLVSAANSPTEVAARFQISSTMQALALQLHDNTLGGLPLAQVEELSYCTRLIDGPRPYAVTLQLNIDMDVTDDDDSWQGRLVYTPSYNGAVIQGEWQCWNTLVGKWWATGGPLTAVAPANSPLPLGTLLAHYPNLGINDSYTAVVLKAGDGWSNFLGEASPMVIGVKGERISMAFGIAPQLVQEQPTQEEIAQENTSEHEILLPVLVNESQPPVAEAPVAPAEAPKPDRWSPGDGRNIDWRNVDWEDFEWDEVDWGKFDWQDVDWDAWPWGGINLHGFVDVSREEMNAFIADVRQCKGRGWETLGFDDAGECIAHFVEAHTLSYMEWNSWGARRQWGSRDNRWNSDDDDHDDNKEERNDHQRRGRRWGND